MALKVVRRKDRAGALTISGTIRFQDGSRIRVVRRAASNKHRLAQEEASTLEAQILRSDWHGERRGSRSFAAAVVSYFEATERSDATKIYMRPLIDAIGLRPLASIDQDTITELRERILRPNPSPATVQRKVISPLRAVMRHAAARGWCELPMFASPGRKVESRTNFLVPDQAERLIDAAAAHLKPLLIFLLGTGARMSEATELEWRDVDLPGGRAIFWRTKSGRRRNVELPPRVREALTSLPSIRPHEDGLTATVVNDHVFLTHAGRPYVDRNRLSGGQIHSSWLSALVRADLPRIRVHDLRHTWATWQYALHKDPMKLKADGGWSSLSYVERYAHLMPAGHEAAIRTFLGLDRATIVLPDTARNLAND